jgi:hypothetical protein
VARFIAVSVELFEDHPLAERPYCTAFAWLDLIRRAKWKDGAGLERGQLRASVRFLAEAWGWSVKRTHTFLVQLEADERIVWTRPRAGKREPGTLSILEYESYQSRDALNGNASVEKRERPREGNAKRNGPSDYEDRQMYETEKRETNANGNANDNKSVPVPVVTTSSLSPSLRSVERDSGEVVQGTLIDVPVEPTPTLVATAMTARWIEEQVTRPPESEIKKQARTFSSIARRESVQHIAQAWEGIGTLYPFSEGRPWDAFDLRKLFGKALQAGALELSDGDPAELARWLREFG